MNRMCRLAAYGLSCTLTLNRMCRLAAYGLSCTLTLNRMCRLAAYGLSCALTLLGGLACSTGTGSQRFEFEARIAGPAEFADAELTFVNEKGWTITLTTAQVTLGPVYLNSIMPLSDGATSWANWLIRSAWADGEGHLARGRVVGELLSAVSFDALSGTFVTFPTRGTMTQEQVRTTDIWFYPADGAANLPVALAVRGRAHRAERQLSFRGELILNQDWIANQAEGPRGGQSLATIRQVRGIATDFFPVEGGVLEIRFDVRRLFRGADFSNLTNNASDVDGTLVLAQGKSGTLTDQVMANLYQGLREANGAYAIHWAPRQEQ